MMVLTTEQEAAVLRLLSLSGMSVAGWIALGVSRDDATQLRDLGEHLTQRAVTRRDINDSIAGRGGQA